MPALCGTTAMFSSVQRPTTDTSQVHEHHLTVWNAPWLSVSPSQDRATQSFPALSITSPSSALPSWCARTHTVIRHSTGETCLEVQLSNITVASAGLCEKSISACLSGVVGTPRTLCEARDAPLRHPRGGVCPTAPACPDIESHCRCAPSASSPDGGAAAAAIAIPGNSTR